MLEKGVIRPCNSTYSAPIWPVLKPNGKWRPTIDYRTLSQQEALSLAYDPAGARNSKNQKARSCPHWTSPPGSGQSLSTLSTNISWHSPSATDSTPSRGAPSAMPTHQQNSTFSLRHALMPESEATSST